ncbi:hypothetical protein FQN54_008966 [Arachnomyces sp. PD_36]|nr:hypothetical protein FQN54_008966 [Arachnomyces sp. PD_36]
MSQETNINVELWTQSRRNEEAISRLATPAGSSDASSQTTCAASSSYAKEELTQDEIDRKPWKYIGYRGFSTFLASDSDFCHFRHFETLNTRVILALQDQLAELEETLDEMDNSYSRREAPDVNNGSFRNDTQQDRVALIWEIREKLEECSLPSLLIFQREKTRYM